MKLIKKTMSAIVIINLILPVGSFAQSAASISNQANEANQLANHAFQELQHAGTEFYLDSTKQKQINPRDFLNGKRMTTKIYAVSPYDHALKNRIAFSESFQITQKGELKITIEILKNEAKTLKSYPIRAIKTVTLYGNNADTAKAKTAQAIRSALSIARNQMTISSKKSGSMELFAAKTMEMIFPSAHAGLISIIGNVIMVAAGAILIKTGYNFLTSKSSEDFEIVRYIGGFGMILMGFKLAHAGVDYLTGEKKNSP
jgi:hypothetical protein